MVALENTGREDGYFLIDSAQDAKSLTLFLQSPITTLQDKLSKAQANFLTLGPEDSFLASRRSSRKPALRSRR
jgi:hypothetical protein